MSKRGGQLQVQVKKESVVADLISARSGSWCTMTYISHSSKEILLVQRISSRQHIALICQAMDQPCTFAACFYEACYFSLITMTGWTIAPSCSAFPVNSAILYVWLWLKCDKGVVACRTDCGYSESICHFRSATSAAAVCQWSFPPVLDFLVPPMEPRRHLIFSTNLGLDI